MRWEQSMVPNDTSAWKDTKGFGGSLKLRWSVLILGKIYQFRSALALACVSGKWTFASWVLLQRAAKVFESNVHFSAGLGRPVWLFGTLQVRPQTFISMCALKTLPALPLDSKESLKMTWSHCRNQRATRDSWTNRLPDRNGCNALSKAWYPTIAHERTLAEQGFWWISEVEMVGPHFWESSSISKYPCSCMCEWKVDVCFLNAASEQQRVLKAMSTSRLAWDARFDCLALCKYAHRHSSVCVLWRHLLTLRILWRWCGLIVEINVLLGTHEPIACAR